jgi:hypothetical protein
MELDRQRIACVSQETELAQDALAGPHGTQGATQGGGQPVFGLGVVGEEVGDLVGGPAPAVLGGPGPSQFFVDRFVTVRRSSAAWIDRRAVGRQAAW